MPIEHHYSPIIANNLTNLVQNNDWNGLVNYLSSLSHSQFRTASNILCEQTLLTLDENSFWECFQIVVPTNTRAFLGTFLKSATALYGPNFKFNNVSLQKFAKWVTDNQLSIDQRKTLQALLPIVRSVDEVEQLFRMFSVEKTQDQIAFLVAPGTTPCYFLLFRCFKKLDHDSALLTLYCNRILEGKKNRAFNFVSLMKSYFDLPNVKAVFSLRLNDYELSRLDSSYADFSQILNRL